MTFWSSAVSRIRAYLAASLLFFSTPGGSVAVARLPPLALLCLEVA